MGTPAIEISWLDLANGGLLLIAPFLLLLVFRTGMVASAAWAILRMVLQLLAVGLYLQYIFTINSALLNVIWALLMAGVAGISIGQRSQARLRFVFLPALTGITLGTLISEAIFLLVVLRLPNALDARYVIPTTGMISGNCLSSSVVGLRSFLQALREGANRYRFFLACGATRQEALLPFMQKSMQNAFQPAIATMATMGLISLPGMMTGQILEGADPANAVRYQILIMLSIFCGTVTAVSMAILAMERTIFRPGDDLKQEIFVED